MASLVPGDIIDLTDSSISDRFIDPLAVVQSDHLLDDYSSVLTSKGYISRGIAERHKLPFRVGSVLRTPMGNHFTVENILWDEDKGAAFVHEDNGWKTPLFRALVYTVVDEESDVVTSGSADYGNFSPEQENSGFGFSEGDKVQFIEDGVVYEVTHAYENRNAYDLYNASEESGGPYSVPYRLLKAAQTPVEPAQVWIEKEPDPEMGTDPGKDRSSIFITRVDGDVVTYVGTWDHYTSTTNVWFIRNYYSLKED